MLGNPCRSAFKDYVSGILQVVSGKPSAVFEGFLGAQETDKGLYPDIFKGGFSDDEIKSFSAQRDKIQSEHLGHCLYSYAQISPS